MAVDSIFIGKYRPDSSPEILRVAVKDNFDVEGQRTTAGTKARMTTPVAGEDAAVIHAVRRDPSVRFIGRTNMDELAAGATGVNPWFGAVENPHLPGRIAGGSSSGSAVAVALDLADVALGTDTGGSVRIPAALNGVFGLKTTIGSISTRGIVPLSQTLDTVGVLAANSAILRRGYGLMIGEVAGSATHTPPRRIARLRFTEDENSIDVAVDSGLSRFTGADIVDVSLADWGEAHRHAFTILSREAWNNWRSLIDAAPENVGAVAAGVLRAGSNVSLQAYGESLRFRLSWAKSIRQILDEVDIIACPVVSTPAPVINDADTIDWSSFSRTMQFNLSGNPAVSIPVPADSGPVGLQLVGKMGSDLALLDLASFWEST